MLYISVNGCGVSGWWAGRAERKEGCVCVDRQSTKLAFGPD